MTNFRKLLGLTIACGVSELACRQPQSPSPLHGLVPKTAEPVPTRAANPSVLISMGDFPTEWLRSRTTVEQAEKDNLVSDPSLGPKPVPFGFCYKDWIQFKRLMKPGDELWNFSEQGGTGLCIVRARKVIACLTLTMV